MFGWHVTIRIAYRCQFQHIKTRNKDKNKDVLMIKLPIKYLIKLQRCLNYLLQLVLSNPGQLRLPIPENKDWNNDVLMIKLSIKGLIKLETY